MQQLDFERLYLAADKKRREEGLTWTELARQFGIKPDVLLKFQYQGTATLRTVLLLLEWLGTPGDLRPYLPDQPKPSEP